MTRFVSDNATYEAIEPLGKGGMGVTHLVRRESDGETLVLKELRIEMLEEWKALELFEREIATLESLDHPGIPRYVDRIVDRDTGMLGLVQSRIEGRTLAELVERGQSVPTERFTALLRDCLEVLDYLHERTPPVIHRDVNPRNVMFDDARAYLIDFGSVKVALRGSTTMTSVGTFGYMPPEQIHGDAEPATDLYGLGMTFIALATGLEPSALPKDRGTGQVDARSVLDVPEPTRSVLLDMIRPGLDGRLGSAREALRRLKEKPGRGRLRRRIAAVAVAVPALVLAGGWVASLVPAEHELATLGGWFSGHGDVLSSMQATLLGRIPMTSSDAVTAVAFRPDGGVVSFARDGGLSWTDGRVTARWWPTGYRWGDYRVAAYSDDGAVLVTATFFGGVTLHDPDTLQLLRSQEAEPLVHKVRGIHGRGKLLGIDARAADDVRLAVFVEDEVAPKQWQSSVVVMEATKARSLFEDEVAWAHLVDGDLSADGTHLAIVGGKGPYDAIVWDIEAGRRVATITQSGRKFLQVVLSADASQVATLDLDGITIWDVATTDKVRSMGVSYPGYRARLAATADLSTVVVTTDAGAEIFDGTTGHLRRTVKGHPVRVTAVAVTPDGSRVATGSRDQTVKIWAAD